MFLSNPGRKITTNRLWRPWRMHTSMLYCSRRSARAWRDQQLQMPQLLLWASTLPALQPWAQPRSQPPNVLPAKLLPRSQLHQLPNCMPRSPNMVGHMDAWDAEETSKVAAAVGSPTLLVSGCHPGKNGEPTWKPMARKSEPEQYHGESHSQTMSGILSLLGQDPSNTCWRDPGVFETCKKAKLQAKIQCHCCIQRPQRSSVHGCICLHQRPSRPWNIANSVLQELHLVAVQLALPTPFHTWWTMT